VPFVHDNYVFLMLQSSFIFNHPVFFISAIFEMPEKGHLFYTERKTIPLTLVLDNIRDPGNMGTLIRTAAAVGCQSVTTIKGKSERGVMTCLIEQVIRCVLW